VVACTGTEFCKLERRSPAKLVDVRSVDEFTGKVIAPPGMTETAQHGGHIPGAVHVPWAQAVNEDGTFKTADALRQLYGSKGVTGTQGSWQKSGTYRLALWPSQTPQSHHIRSHRE
jgi:3-mercaptopyruvate sulfurtransferase SseA